MARDRRMENGAGEMRQAQTADHGIGLRAGWNGRELLSGGLVGKFGREERGWLGAKSREGE
jgi:hypothetical protein